MDLTDDDGLEAASGVQTPGLTMADLLAMGNTGAQGKPVAAYAPDLARSGGRVAKILERGIDKMEKDKGFGNIGAALAQDLATGGRSPYAVNRLQFEGKEMGQVVNAANAITGLSKVGGLDAKSMGNMLMRKTEQEARLGNSKAQRINEMVRGVAGGFEDSAMASAHIYSYLGRKQAENPNMDLADLPTLISEAVMDARKNGLGRKLSGRGSRGSGGGGGAKAAEVPTIPTSDTGAPDYAKPFAKPKTEFERMWNMSDSATRKKMFEAKTRKLTGEDSGTGAPEITQNPDGSTTFRPGVGKSQDAKFDDEFRRADMAARETFATLGDIEADLDKYGGTVVGVVGSAGGALSALRSQVEALLDSSPNSSVTAAAKSRFGDTSSWEKFMPNFVLNGPNAAVMKSRFVTLAYALASSREPGGRLTEGDVERAMKTLGESGGDVRAIRLLIAESKKTTERRMRSMQSHSKTFSQSAPWSGQGWQPYSKAPRAGGAAPLSDASTEDLLKAARGE
jgi:hypothetical protein